MLYLGIVLRRKRKRKGELMASIRDVERLADDLETISEHADNAAQTFTSVNDALMSRLDEVTGSKRSSSGQSRKRSTTAASS